MKNKTLVGIRPTGKLHIGHYFSVIKPALEEGADVLIARYHSSPPMLRGECTDLMLMLGKFGLNPHIQHLHSIKYFDLVSVSRMGELQRMTQYKSTKKKTPHLLMYPVLMAHDLMGYHRVIVGGDQRQHVEYANLLFERLGLPKIEGDFRGGRIMSLTDPTKKMSKSEPEGCLFLDDDFEKKLKKAVTTPEGIKNLAYIAKQFGVKWDEKDNENSKKNLAKALEKKFK